MAALKTITGRLLISLSLILLQWRAEAEGMIQVSGGVSMYLGQQREAWKPLLQTSANLSEIRSYMSTFLFRTFDPEGAVFYGDTKDGEDWFVLSLHEGVPVMQIKKENMLVSAAGGPKINDGQWHRLGMASKGKFVSLEVDGSQALEVGMDTKEAHDELVAGKIRMAVGGILIDKGMLIVPLQPEMDACVREGNWLNLTTPWETEEEELWPCYQNIRPGSYFPGNGFAVYNISVFQHNAKIKMEMWGDFSQIDGTILSIRAPGQALMLTLEANKNTKDVTLSFGEHEIIMKHSFNRLAIIFQKDSVQFLRYKNPTEHEMESIITESMQKGYLTMMQEGRFAIGGLLGEGEGYVGSNYLKGCLEKIQINGKDLDLDSAVKHASVSSYSCPA